MAYNYYEEFEKRAAAMSVEDFSRASEQFAMSRLRPGQASEAIPALAKYKAAVGTPSQKAALDTMLTVLGDYFANFDDYLETYHR